MKSEPRYRWLKVRSLFERRALPTCTRLVDGRVRVDGGSYYDVDVYETRVATTEIYAPDEDRWTKGDVDVPAVAPPIAKAPHVRRGSLKKRERPTLTTLPTGEVLVTGGFETTCRFDGEEDNHSCRDVELVDVRGHEVQDAGQLAVATHDHGVVVLASGAVLVIGGNEGDTHGSREVQLGVPSGLDLATLGPALSRLAKLAFGDQAREALLAEVRRLTDAGQLHDALALAHEAANTSPNSADAWRALGATLAAAKRFAEAADPLRCALALDPDSPFAIVALADVLFLDGKKSEAKSHYERVVALCRDDSTWTSQIVRRAREQLQYMELESGDVRQVALGPGPDASSLEWNNAGAEASRLGRHEDALAAFERATKIDPKNEYAWGNVASTLIALERPEDALAAAAKTLRLCHDVRRRAEAYVSRGIALHDLGRYAQSIQAYDKSLELYAMPYVWSNRGNSLHKLGRDDDALASFEKASALGWPMAHWGRACVWVARGDFEQAQAAVDAAAKLDPSLVPRMRDDEELAPLWKRASPMRAARPAGRKSKKNPRKP